MRELLNRKLKDLSEIERDMLLESGYEIVVEEEDYLYIDFDLGVRLKIKIDNLRLE